MRSRTRIAAAACLVASGLLATGSSASLAFATPEPGSPGSDPGSGAGSTPGGGTSQPSGPTTGETSTGSSTPPNSGPFGPWGSIFRPPVTVGNGRNGIEIGVPGLGSLIPTMTLPRPTPSSKPPTVPAPPSGQASGGGQTRPSGTPADTTAPEGSGTTPVGTGNVPPAIGTGAESPTGNRTSDKTGVPAAPLSWWSGLPAGTTLGEAGFDPLIQLPQKVLTQVLAPGQAIPGFSAIADPILEVVTGLSTAASKLPFLPATLPVIVVPDGVTTVTDPVIGRGGGATTASAPRLTPPLATQPEITPANTTPAETVAPKESDRTPPATAMSNELLAAPTYRMGYVDYLRAAGLGEVAAVAVPGVTGMLVLTGAGGLIGYRQARAGRAVRAGGTARFMG